MKIGELSARSGVSQRSLRYYEERGLISAHREPNGYRDYDESTVEQARTIHMLFGMDFPRDVVQSVLACAGPAPAATHDALADQLEVVLDELTQRITKLSDTRQQIETFLESRGRRSATSSARG